MARLNVPYHQSPATNACALACHLMTGQCFVPDLSMEELKGVLRWQEGYVVWGFPFYLWLMARGAAVEITDTWDYDALLTDGIEGMRRICSPESFTFLTTYTKNIEGFFDDIRACFAHPLFSYRRQAVTFDAVFDAVSDTNTKSVEVVLCSRILNGQEGYMAHRVIPLAIEGDIIEFHDPRRPELSPEPNRRIDVSKFTAALNRTQGEMVVYRTCRTGGRVV